MRGDSFGSRRELRVGDRTYSMFSLSALDGLDVGRLPYSLKVLLENLLRNEDGVSVTATDVEALARWDPSAAPDEEIAFSPARILMQDFTGVPAVVDLAAMRDGVEALGGDPVNVNPQVPTELVIDHSVIVDRFGTPDSFDVNARLEFDRNRERYQFLRWGQQAFDGFRVVPPDTGICHQVNLEGTVALSRAPSHREKICPSRHRSWGTRCTVTGSPTTEWAARWTRLAACAPLMQQSPRADLGVPGARDEGECPSLGTSRAQRWPPELCSFASNATVPVETSPLAARGGPDAHRQTAARH